MHLSGGVIEMHFHFFVMVAVVSLYQDWLPFLTAVAYVFVHHTLLGSIAPESVFNHQAAWDHPWRWAALHAGFIAGISAACLVAWRLNEETFAAAEAARRRLAILAEAGQVLAASTDVEQTLAALTRLITPEIADSCAVYLSDGDATLRPIVAHANYPPPDGRPFGSDTIDAAHAAHPVAEVVRTGSSQLIELVSSDMIDRALDEPANREFVHRIGPTSAIIVPIRGRSEVIGALALGTVQQSGRVLQQSDVGLAEELARRAAVAIEHARLFAAQRDVAETLQHSLLPDVLPIIPGLDVAARYVPGGSGVDVGGDWYDVLSFGDGTLGLVMGDVVGRGIPAASLMGQIRNALRAYALEHKDPREVLRRLNTVVNELGPSQGMATLLYGVFDMDSSTLTLANAGHPPPLIANGRNEARFVEGGLGPPLGAVLDPTYVSVTTDLPPGSTLVMYTDGLVEDRLTPLDVGLERMCTFVAGGPEDLDALCDHVMSSALAGRSGGDDAALVALRVLPVQVEVRLTLPRQPDVIRGLRATLRRQLRNAGASKKEEFEILVAAGEACANAIQHAGPASSTFDFESFVDDEVRIVVRDRGRWREQRPSDGGRGLSIMEHFMDHVDVNRASGGTEVVMRRGLSEARANGIA